MSSSADASVEAGPRSETVFRVLDLAFGFFAWAIHFLVVYVGAAIYCVLHPDAAETGGSPALLTALAVVTLAAAFLVVGHAWLRYRRRTGLPDERFRLAVTIGCDALAAVAIVLQLFPIGLVPACA